jgi:hypothetical protein
VTLSPEAAALVAKGEAERRSGAAANRAAAAYRAEAAEERENTGMLVAITPGVTVWTDPAKLRGADDEITQQDGAMSGVVLDGYTYHDEYGYYRLGWRVFNPFAGPQSPQKRFPRWPESVLAPWRTERTDPHLLAGYWRRMLRILAEGSGLPSAQEATIAADAWGILGALMAEGGRK